MEKKVYLIITAIVNKENASELQTYLETTGPLIGKNGGKPFGKFKTTKNLLGDDSQELMNIIEFPNEDAIKNLVNSEEFNEHSELRSRVFSKLNMVICESM